MSWQHQTSIGRNNFDFLRFALAVSVIFSHSFVLPGYISKEPLLRLTGGQIPTGDLAVDYFFVISGFLIAHSWLRSKSTVDFFKKRVLRIYPAFIAAIILCTFVAAPMASSLVRQHFIRAIQPTKLIADMTILRYREPDGAFLTNPVHIINGSLWTIPYEFRCYIAVAVVGLIGLLKKPGIISLIFLALICISLFVYPYQTKEEIGHSVHIVLGDPAKWARLLPYYFAGVTFYLFRHQIPFSRIYALLCAFLLIGAALFPPYCVRLLLPTTGTYLLFWFAFEPKIRLENWARFGDFSYGIYVFAYPIQQLVIMKWGAAISPIELFLISTPPIILAGVLSWHLIERRFLKLKKVPIIPPQHRSTLLEASTKI